MKINQIVGFRSNKLWKKAVAILYYLTLAIMFLTMFSAFSEDITFQDKIIDVTSKVFIFVCFLIPFVVTIFKNKLTIIFRRKLYLNLASVFTIFALLLASGFVSDQHTSEYKATQLAKQQLEASKTEAVDLSITETIEEISDQTTSDTMPISSSSELSSIASSKTNITNTISTSDKTVTTTTFPTSVAPTTVAPTTQTSTDNIGVLTVHFIDVGQADSILIVQGSASMLIDAGNNADGTLVESFLKKQGIKKLDFVIGTHPHEDHIGGLDNVINSFEIGKIILPNASNTTKTFEDVLTAIQNKNLKITKAVIGSNYSLGQASIEILGPALSSFTDLNDASVVCKVSFGSTSFLFEGDAEKASESAMIQMGEDLAANVLKVGHHGSNSSTSAAFLKAVNPTYAIISVGAGNTYGHPASETLSSLKSSGIKLFRTDLCGTIIATSDGKSISFNSTPSYGSAGQVDTVASTAAPTTIAPTTIATTTKVTEPQVTTSQESIVYVTNTGAKYHRDGCRYLSESKIPISLADAIAQGYTPCSVCDP